ncbi:MAG: SDR family oxidoreductase [Ignavibacteriales bacterium]|nr:SDR family oxidoreductase [Ignavibacteriales bacterium]MCF8306837.1 SDR family oxidoreductase [Ignavibacteriales bacterium]MCF8316865.1 SDR family oxidoreductase [Ignavibacteriales bacterium]MCF8438096.1 SDR family oxidoreductase [Ignavibacteriales bacterium]
MFSLQEKIVLITGATAGIGLACAEIFAESGSDLILCGRRASKLSKIANNIKKTYGVNVYSFKLDVRNKKNVEYAIRSLPDDWKKIDILINNAGLGRGLNKFHEDDTDGWEEMIDTNVKGLLYVTKEVLPLMLEKGEGHVINIGSIAGHEVYPKGAVYCSTKHAVDAITKGLRMDLLDRRIRVSTVDPGMVETEFSQVRFHGDKEKAANVYRNMHPLSAKDVAEGVLFCATRPPHANVNQMVIMPSVQASATQVYRKEELPAEDN